MFGTRRLRALELPAGEARVVREVALTALGALTTALFTEAHTDSDCARALAALVAEEVGSIAALLAIRILPAPAERTAVEEQRQ